MLGKVCPLFSTFCDPGLPCPVEPGWKICSAFFQSWPMLGQTGLFSAHPHSWPPQNQTCHGDPGLQSACQCLWSQFGEVATPSSMALGILIRKLNRPFSWQTSTGMDSPQESCQEKCACSFMVGQPLTDHDLECQAMVASPAPPFLVCIQSSTTGLPMSCAPSESVTLCLRDHLKVLPGQGRCALSLMASFPKASNALWSHAVEDVAPLPWLTFIFPTTTGLPGTKSPGNVYPSSMERPKSVCQARKVVTLCDSLPSKV